MKRQNVFKPAVQYSNHLTEGYVPWTWFIERLISGKNVSLLTLLQHPEAPPLHVAWQHIMRVAPRVPISVQIHLVREMHRMKSTTAIVGLRTLTNAIREQTSFISPTDRLHVAQLHLEYNDFLEEALWGIDELILNAKNRMQLEPTEFGELWESIAKREMFCPQKMCEWLDAMQDVDWNFSAETAVLLMVSKGKKLVPAPLALRILDTYIRLAEKQCPNALSPLPFVTFFLAARGSLLMLEAPIPAAHIFPDVPRTLLPGHLLSWEIVWARFQMLNRRVPTWWLRVEHKHKQHICHSVLELMVLKAPPPMVFTLSCTMFRYGCSSNAIELSVLLMKRLPNHLNSETAVKMMRTIYNYLISHKFHTSSHAYQADIFVVANALIRMQLYDCIVNLYDFLFDENVAESTQEFKSNMITVFSDIVCPSCSSVLKNKSIYVERMCSSCFQVIPGKPSSEKASFEASTDQVAASRVRRAVHLKQTVSEMRKYVIDSREKHHTDQESLEKLKKVVFEDPIVPAMHVYTVSGKKETISLPLNQIDAVDFRALLRRDSALSRRQEIALRQHALIEETRFQQSDLHLKESSAFADTLVSQPFGVRSKTPTEVVFPQLKLDLLVHSTSKESKQETSVTNTQHALNSESHATESSSLFIPSNNSGLRMIPWTCIWCEEDNPKEVHVHCFACGAETGPAAGWRPLRATGPTLSADNYIDPLSELRTRLQNIHSSPRSVVAATYTLMLFRKKYLLHATKEELHNLNGLVQELVLRKERVMAAYVFFHIIPSSTRERRCVPDLMRLFGTATSENLERVATAPSDTLTYLVLGNDTCSVCYDQSHTWMICPIVTRRFPPTSSQRHTTAKPLTLSAFQDNANSRNETLKEGGSVSIHEQISHQQVRVRAPAITPKELVHAFEKSLKEGKIRIAFRELLGMPRRQIYVEQNGHEHVHELLFHVLETGDDSERNLGKETVGSMTAKRAAYLLAIIPRHLRKNEAYQRVAAAFGIHPGDIQALLAQREVGNAASIHPHFSQVFGTCSVCLVGVHASEECPLLLDWYTREIKCHDSASHRRMDKKMFKENWSMTNATTPSKHRQREISTLGFISSGPERLVAFHKFLVNHMKEINQVARTRSANRRDEEIREFLKSGEHPSLQYIALGINACVDELIRLKSNSEALQLVILSDRCLVSNETLHAVMRSLGHSDNDTRSIQQIQGTIPLEYILPANYCMVCFRRGHILAQCPVHAWKTPEHRVIDTVTSLIQLAQPSAICVAADYVLSIMLRRRLDQILRSSVALQKLNDLVLILIQNQELNRALRMYEMIPSCTDEVERLLWTAIDVRENEALRLRQLRSNNQRDFFQTLTSNGVCPHCAVREDHTRKCPTLQSYLDMGRNLLAIFRTGILEEEKVGTTHRDQLHALCCKYRDHLPYYIPAVQRVTNALSACYSMTGDVFRAMEQLRAIPPQYRERFVYEHLLRAYGVPREIEERMLRDYRPRTEGDMTRKEPAPERDIISVISGKITGNEQELCMSCWTRGHTAKVCPSPRQRILPVQLFSSKKLFAEVEALQSDFEARLGEGVGTNHVIFRGSR